MTTPTDSPTTLARTTLTMTAITAVSRVTGLVRVLVVAAVLGATFLGNTYQSANAVPNLVFELFVAGALQAALIPSLVGVFDRDETEAEHVARSVLGLTLVVVGLLALAGAVVAPWVMRGLVAGVDDPAIRDDQIELGTIFLWIFLPQILFYAMGLVATAVLNARDRFVLPVAAPIVNNVVVVAAYLIFDSMRGDAGPSLDLSAVEIAVLAGGTTLAVLTFTLVPVVAAVRSGVSLWPRFDRTHPAVRRIARDGAWAAAWLAGTQVLLGVVLVLANGVEGGVVVWQVALTFFLLPHALFALPVITALFPRMARDASGSPAEAGPAVRQGIRAIGLLTLPAAAVLAVLGGAAAQLVLVGEGEAAAGDVGRAAAAFAAGLPAYGLFLFLTRAFYAAGDARTPAIVSWALAGGGALALVLAATLAGDGDRITALAAAYSVSYVIAAVTLAVMLRARVLGAQGLAGVAGALTRYGAMAVAAGGVMAAIRHVVPDPSGRLELAVGELIAPALAGVAVLALFDSLMGGDGRRALHTALGRPGG